MSFIRQLSYQFSVWVTERRMWWRHKTNPEKYEKTRMWIRKKDGLLTPQVYEEALQFVRQTVNLAPRPYGKGAYGLKVAVAWAEEDEEEDRSDDWQMEFLYEGREAAYAQLKAWMESWDRPPDGMMVGVLPYGALTEGL